jgi:DNA-binding beta-propeller fold protein YncE
MTFDKQGNLYVANSGRPAGRSGSARAYNAMGRQILAIKQVSAPVAVAFAASGNLVVANQDSRLVSFYQPKSISPVRSITTAQPPAMLLIGSGGNVYVGESYRVEVFAPGASAPTRTLAIGRCDDLGIKISPRAVVEDGLPQRLQETRVAMRSQA